MNTTTINTTAVNIIIWKIWLKLYLVIDFMIIPKNKIDFFPFKL